MIKPKNKCRNCDYFSWIPPFHTDATCALQPGNLKDSGSRACRLYSNEKGVRLEFLMSKKSAGLYLTATQEKDLKRLKQLKRGENKND